MKPLAAAMPVDWGSGPARWILAATVAGSGLALLDATTVNVALPAIAADLGATVGGLQWTINGYTLTLAGGLLAQLAGVGPSGPTCPLLP